MNVTLARELTMNVTLARELTMSATLARELTMSATMAMELLIGTAFTRELTVPPGYESYGGKKLKSTDCAGSRLGPLGLSPPQTHTSPLQPPPPCPTPSSRLLWARLATSSKPAYQIILE